MKRWLVGLGATLLLVSALTYAPRAATPPDFATMQIQPYSPPKPAPTFPLPDPEAKTVNLADPRGKVRLLCLWATW